jgi:high-affinity Fe2+/Pb2+ permease
VLIIVAAAIATVVRDMVTGALAARPAGRPLSTVAYWLIMSFGIIAALGQINIATTVTTPVLVTVGLGGGLIKPAQRRWDGWLANLQGQFRNHGQPPRQVGTLPPRDGVLNGVTPPLG